MNATADIAKLSSLALDVWRFGLSDKGAHLFVVVARVERATSQVQDPAAISKACRDLMKAGMAERTGLGYRAKQARQDALPLEEG